MSNHQNPYPIIELHGVAKTFTTQGGPLNALRDVDLRVDEGEFVTIVGRSGSGKSTLLNLLTGIDRPTTGAVRVAGTTVHTLSEDRMAAWRGRTVGIVFQFFQLLPTLTVVENVMLPMDFCNAVPTRLRRPRALELLATLDVGKHADKLPAELSGGQQQRAAIARALANDPPILVADEPTGNLDSQTSDAVLELFSGLASRGRTVVMVTHEHDVERLGARCVTLADGRLVQAGTPVFSPARSAAGARTHA
jgi:putative ABC transport system ATP-binding protein